MSENGVTVIDYGLNTLDRDVEQLLQGILAKAAYDLKAQMQANIAGRGDTDKFFDTGATANSVVIESPDPFTRDVGPTTSYAYYGEMGWTQTTAWGHPIKAGPRHHAPIRFAREALNKIGPAFAAAIRAALGRLGRPG